MTASEIEEPAAEKANVMNCLSKLFFFFPFPFLFIYFSINSMGRSCHMSWHMMSQSLVGVMDKECTDQLKVV